MRDIKFRGFSKDENRFIYGDLVHNKGCQAYRIIENFTLSGNFPNGNYEVYEESGIYLVDPETIGQFTGLQDKNGKDIYEGDVIIVNKFESEAEYQFIINDIRQMPNEMFGSNVNWIEIIGNIHENKDLLK